MPVSIPPLAVNHLVHSRIFARCLGQAGMIDLWHVIKSLTGTPSYPDFAGAIDNQIGAVMVNQWWASDVFYVGCTSQQVDPLTLKAKTIQFPNVGNQGAGGETPPTTAKQASAIISFRTYKPGPKYRGRVYVPFIPANGFTTGGEMSAAQMTALQLVQTAIGIQLLVVGPPGFAADLVIPHRDGESLPDSVAYTLINASVANQIRRGDFRSLNKDPF